MVIESGIGALREELPLGDEAPYLHTPPHLEPPAENSERGETSGNAAAHGRRVPPCSATARPISAASSPMDRV